eukprot:1178692-Prorocentrum_minimum.AAC.3
MKALKRSAGFQKTTARIRELTEALRQDYNVLVLMYGAEIRPSTTTTPRSSAAPSPGTSRRGTATPTSTPSTAPSPTPSVRGATRTGPGLSSTPSRSTSESGWSGPADYPTNLGGCTPRCTRGVQRV